jgi:GT2 family glycosyltransferase
MNVSIITVGYNTRQCLKNCLNSVKEQTTGIDCEIIVVDNDSQDGSREMLREEFHDVKLICSENNGFGAANNLVSKAATGKYLFLLNPDTLLINNAVKILSDYLDVHPEAGACGGNLYNADGITPTNSCWNYFAGIAGAINLITVTLASRIRRPQTHKYNRSEYPQKVAWVSGANLMVRRSLFEQIGGFDENFFLYCEDVDLCYRINQAGFAVVSHPDAKIIHLEGQSSGGSTIVSPHALISFNSYLHKRYPQRWKRFLCNCLYVVGFFNMMLACIVKGEKKLIRSYWSRLIEQCNHLFS